jgi:hypothetical protein
MTKIAAFRNAVRSYRDGHPRSLGSLSCHRETGSPVSPMPCPLLASVSVLVAIMPVSQLTLLLLLFLVLDIGVAMLLGRDFCAYRRTKFTAIASIPGFSRRGARLIIGSSP